jgi:type II secretory pathway pseudopilin PulG
MGIQRVRSRLQSESGIGLIELLIAMTILSVAISAQLAVFGSAFSSLERAGRKGTAVMLADKQMELYRRVDYSCIYLSSASGDSTYTSDAAYSGSQVVASNCAPNTSPPTAATTASQVVTGPDGRSYRIDTYIVAFTPTGGRQGRAVTVVVRKMSAGVVDAVLTREASTFDAANPPSA